MKKQSKVERFVFEMELKKYSPQTVRSYKSVVATFLSIMQIDPIRIPQEDIKIYLRKASSVADLKIKISALKLFYKLIIKQPLKFKYIEYPRKQKLIPRIINHEEIVSKLNGIKNLKHKAILSLAYCCGLRVSEVVNLKIEHINGRERVILVSQSKGNKDRYVPVSDGVLSVLRAYFGEFRPKVYLFNGVNSLKYSVASCQKLFKKYIDVKHSFHHLRHSSLTTMLENGTDLRVLQTIAGHSSPNTTAIYTHVSHKFLQQVNTPI